jgi:hypothetical protein
MREQLRGQRSLRMEAAGFAALAEAGVLFLPLMEFSWESVKASGGPLQEYGIVAPLFVVGVLAGLNVRRFRLYLWGAAGLGAGVGLAEALGWGDGNAPGTAFLVVLTMLAAWRMVSLAARDWREPVKESFVWGSLVVLVEILIAGSANAQWRALLPVVVVLFFAGSLASRAASVMLDRAGEAEPSRSAERGRRLISILLLSILGGFLGLSVVLGGHHGLFRIVGGLAAGVVGLALLGLAYVTARVLLEPLSWVLARLHFSLAPLQRLIRRFAHPRAANQRAHHLVNAPWGERLIGVAVMVGVAFTILWLIHRLRLRAAPGRRSATTSPVPVPTEVEPNRNARIHRRRLRRELPADLVRRWYAEALLLLERRGLGKPAAVTPSEYLGDVVRAFPPCGTQFESLTRAYEDVRYGNRTISSSVLQEVEAGRHSMMELFRRSDRADGPPEGDDGGEETG